MPPRCAPDAPVYGIRRIRQHHAEGTQVIASSESRSFQGITARDGEVLHTVQYQVHPGEIRKSDAHSSN
ncbi:MAG: hypothetical protein JXA33_24185 [Anaerolineae bacterium]|nr:hypothetical protein [Anaerolineae bacterium]